MSSVEFEMSIQLSVLSAAKNLSTSANSAYEVTAMIRTEKLKEDEGTNGGQRQLIDSSLITSDDKQLGHVYEDIFVTSPNTAYGTASKTIYLLVHIVYLVLKTKLS